MRRRFIAVLVLAMMSALTFSAPAFAHQAGPCAPTNEPGHSEFAQHHVVPAAQEGELGEGGHNPGEHRGFSGACEPSS
jgi:hypothetical protein